MSAFIRQIDLDSLIEQLVKDSLFIRMRSFDLSGYQTPRTFETNTWKHRPASEQVIEGTCKRVDEPLALVPNLE